MYLSSRKHFLGLRKYFLDIRIHFYGCKFILKRSSIVLVNNPEKSTSSLVPVYSAFKINLCHVMLMIFRVGIPCRNDNAMRREVVGQRISLWRHACRDALQRRTRSKTWARPAPLSALIKNLVVATLGLFDALQTYLINHVENRLFNYNEWTLFIARASCTKDTECIPIRFRMSIGIQVKLESFHFRLHLARQGEC